MGATLTAEQVNLTLDVSHTCKDGGTLKLTGNYMVAAGGVVFDNTAAFTDCESNGVKMGGTLTWKATASQGGSTVTMKGTLTTNNGTCVFDYKAEVTAGSATVSGTICGYDVASSSKFNYSAR